MSAPQSWGCNTAFVRPGKCKGYCFSSWSLLSAQAEIQTVSIALSRQWMVSRIKHTINFLGIKVRMTGLWFPGPFFLTFLKRAVIFTFLQSSGTSLSYCDWEIIESGLAITWASCLSTHRYILPWPMDLLYQFAYVFLELIIFQQGLLQPFTLVSDNGGSWRSVLLLKRQRGHSVPQTCPWLV